MAIDFDAAQEIISFSSIKGVSFDDAEAILTERLSKILNQEVTLFFSCPLISDNTDELYFVVGSSRLSVNITPVSPEYLRDNDPTLFMRIIYFEELDEEKIIKPKLIIKFSEPIHQDHISIVENLVKDFVLSMLRRQYSKIRRTIINAKIDSDDLGSFLHRLFHRHDFHRLLNSEAASVFALDHFSETLHLRGTTGLAVETPMSDVNFHVDDVFNVSGVFRDKKPRIDYESGELLALGRSSEATIKGQFTKAYWPLQLRATSSPKARTHSPRPCIGVIRIVNYVNPYIQDAPYTWLPICCLVYAAESLHNIMESFIAKDEASFNKDAAFHGSMSVVDTIAKNIDIVRQSIFENAGPVADRSDALFFLGA